VTAVVDTSADAEADTSAPVSLVVADDAPLIVEGIRYHVEHDSRFTLVGSATDGTAALELCGRTRPNVALIGRDLSGNHIVALLHSIHEVSPSTRTALLGRPGNAEAVHEAVMVGALGYLFIQEDGDFILDALYRMASGRPAFSLLAERSLMDAVRSRGESDEIVPSGREIEILGLLAAGSTAKEVGQRLFVSEATVKTYLRRLYAKLAVSDRAAAVAEAMRRGWLA